MEIIKNIFDLNKAIKSFNNFGFVPTMGGIHNGHISLIKKSQKKTKKTIVSIFVNPKQFNKKKDFAKYPRNLNRDIKILKKLNIDILFIPSSREIYKKKFNTIKLSKSDKILCAKFRKGHFEGVLDVMDRFTSLIKPRKIFMGEKDFQQLFLVKNYIERKYKSKIILCKTVRNKNKLALSSRNILLKKKEITNAEKLSKDLILFKKKLIKKKEILKLIKVKKNELKKTYNVYIEYFELRNINSLKKTNKLKNSKLFIAYYINGVRLIDNF